MQISLGTFDRNLTEADFEKIIHSENPLTTGLTGFVVVIVI